MSRQYDVIPLASANISVATGPPKVSCERCSWWEIARLESYNQKCCWLSEFEFWRCVNATAAVRGAGTGKGSDPSRSRDGAQSP